MISFKVNHMKFSENIDTQIWQFPLRDVCFTRRETDPVFMYQIQTQIFTKKKCFSDKQPYHRNNHVSARNPHDLTRTSEKTKE